MSLKSAIQNKLRLRIISISSLCLVIIFILVLIIKWRIGADVNPGVHVFQIPEFSDGVGADRVAKETVEVSVPRGEKKSFEILLDNTSNVNYNFPNFSIAKTDLVSPTGDTISQNNIDERVVHVWPKKYRPFSVPQPEDSQCTTSVNTEDLLVRNERPSFQNVNAQYNGDTFFSNDIGLSSSSYPDNFGNAPTESGDSIKSSLPAGASKKFYFTITAPDDKVGAFDSTISFIDTSIGPDQAVATFKIKLKIYDFNLIGLNESTPSTPSYLNGSYMNEQIIKTGVAAPTSLDAGMIDESLFLKRVQILKDNGIGSLVIRVGKYSDSLAMIKSINDAGFSGPLILNFYGTVASPFEKDVTISEPADVQDFRAIIDSINSDPSITIPIMFYGVDEANAEPKLQQHKDKANNIIAILNSYAGALPSNLKHEITTSMMTDTADALNADPNPNYHTDYPIENYHTQAFFDNKVVPFTRANNPVAPKVGETFYYQGWGILQLPDGSFVPRNRYYSGIGIAKSGFRGSFVNPVMGYSGTTVRPLWDDFTRPGCTKPMLTYSPASDGYIPNMESETWREGTLDLRFYREYKKIKATDLSTLPQAKRDALSQLATQIETSLNYSYTQTIPVAPPAAITAERMETTRIQLESYVFTYYDPPAPVISDINLIDGQTIALSNFDLSATFQSYGNSTGDLFVDSQFIYEEALNNSSSFNHTLDLSSYNGRNVEIKLVLTDQMGTTTEIRRNAVINFSADEPIDPIDDTTPPVISDQNFVDGQTIRSGDFSIKAKATDASGISKVEYYINGSLESSVTTPDAEGFYNFPFDAIEYNNTSVGLNIIAHDEVGNSSTFSSSLIIDIAVGDTTPPEINGKNISNGLEIVDPDFEVEANVTDNTGVAKVEFYVNGTLMTVDNTAEGSGNYSSALNPISLNQMSLPIKIKAYDMAGNTDEYEANVDINIPDAVAPVIQGINIEDKQVITVNPFVVQVRASDNARVVLAELYVDDIKVDQMGRPDMSGLYELSWNTYDFHSAVKVVVTDSSANKTEALRDTTVNLNSSAITPSPGSATPSMTLLPRTGYNFVTSICDKLKAFFSRLF